MLSIILLLFLFTLTIAIHEYGHYYFAKKNGLPIKEYCIGFPPRIWSRTSKKTGIKYSLGLIFAGGFLSLKKEQKTLRGMNFKVATQVLLGGVLMNFLLALILIIGFSIYENITQKNYFVVNSVSIENIEDFQQDNNLIGSKYISTIGGEKLFSSSTIDKQLLNCKISGCEIEMKDGSTINLNELPDLNSIYNMEMVYEMKPSNEVGYYNLILGKFHFVKDQIATSFLTGKFLFKKVTGQRPIMEESEANSLEGLHQVFENTTSNSEIPFSQKILFIVMFLITLNLIVGGFNLLPIPALDGGQWAFALFRAIFLKFGIELAEKKYYKVFENTLNFGAFMVLMGWQVWYLLVNFYNILFK